MRKLMILAILMLLIIGCADIMASRARIKERGVECRYNKRGGVENCQYMN